MTFSVFSTFFSCLIAFTAADFAVEDAEDAAGVGVPVRDVSGVTPTCKSFPCVSMIAVGNCANFSSSNAGNCFLASAYSLSTAGDDAVDKDQLYCALLSYGLQKFKGYVPHNPIAHQE